MNAILELHGAPTGNCIRAAIALEEAGLAYRVRLVDLSKGQHKGADHLSLNSAGKVPVLVERKGDELPFVLTQSNAIIFYAAEKAPGRLLPTAAGHRATVYERFFFFLTDVIAPSHSAFFLRGQGLSDASARLVERMLSTIELAEQFVSADAYMGGELFLHRGHCGLQRHVVSGYRHPVGSLAQPSPLVREGSRSTIRGQRISGIQRLNLSAGVS